MAKNYSVAEARAHLPEILDEVEAGGDVQLTRRGRAVAVVLPAQEYEVFRSGRPRFGDAYRKFIDRHSLKKLGVTSAFVESLRDKRPARPVKL